MVCLAAHHGTEYADYLSPRPEHVHAGLASHRSSLATLDKHFTILQHCASAHARTVPWQDIQQDKHNVQVPQYIAGLAMTHPTLLPPE